MSLSSWLADALFWVAVACCIVAQGAILRSVLRAGRSRAAAGTEVPRTRQGAEIVWAIVPALVLALVLAATWRSMHPSL